MNILTRRKPPIPITPFLLLCHRASASASKLPEYEMPTVTWGAIQGRKDRLVSRVIISDYLKSVGVLPDELSSIELPSTVAVIIVLVVIGGGAGGREVKVQRYDGGDAIQRLEEAVCRISHLRG